MKELILTLLILPFVSHGQEKDNPAYHHNISLNSYLSAELDGLSYDFIHTISSGAFITNEMKKKWINIGNTTNKINAEIINQINYKYSTESENNYYLQISDMNLLNSSFSEDLLRLLLEGNYEYQDKTLDFSNTIIRINRYQQYKIGYQHLIDSPKRDLRINAAISYLNGNHHMSYIINKGTIYTAPLGSSIDVNYDMQSLVTDTSDNSLFIGNGKGFAIDLGFMYTNHDNIFHFSIIDLGYIHWNKESIVATADSNFSFSGIELNSLEEILDYNDSITEFDIESSYDSNNKKFLSPVPAKITVAYLKKLNRKYGFTNINTMLQYRWQPYEIKEPLSLNLLKRGIEESGYTPNLEIVATITTKYLLIEPGLTTGGFSDNLKVHLSVSNKKRNITLGTYHLQSLFNKERTSISGYLQLSTRF